MNPLVEINELVDVIPVFRAHTNERSICIPRKMKYGGREIEFTTLGMRHPTSKGRRMIHVFDVSDGVNDYRLEFDAERLTWTLVGIIEGF